MTTATHYSIAQHLEGRSTGLGFATPVDELTVRKMAEQLSRSRRVYDADQTCEVMLKGEFYVQHPSFRFEVAKVQRA